MSWTDFEFIFLLLLATLLFALGLRRRSPLASADAPSRFPGIDLPMSAAMKGIACVLILMGHFVNWRSGVVEPTAFSTFIYRTTANVALVWFMFFSGYGLSLKPQPERGLGRVWLSRLEKVYVPLLLVSVVSLAFYALLPDHFSPEEAALIRLPEDIALLHHPGDGAWQSLVPHLFGWPDWYVFCIIVFYSFFYLSAFLTRRHPERQTRVLWALFVLWYVVAYFGIGAAQAHWYRYCWAFFCGHVYAKAVVQGRFAREDAVGLVILTGGFLLDMPILMMSYAIALLLLAGVALLGRRWTMESRPLAFMGGISYFFYLTHLRIGYPVMAYTNLYSVLFWVAVTTLVSFLFSKVYLKKRSTSRTASGKAKTTTRS